MGYENIRNRHKYNFFSFRREKMRKRNEKNKFIKVCPSCGSTNLGVQSLGYSVSDFCMDCNRGNIKDTTLFSNNQFPLMEKNKARVLRDKLKKLKGSIKQTI